MRHSIHLPTDHATVFSTSTYQSVAITNAGLVLGDGSVLIRMSKGEGAPRLSLDADQNRFVALMSTVGDRPLASDAFRHLEAADRFWQRGDKALANLRLIFADLPRLATLCDVHRLTLAAHLLDEGLAPDALTKELGLELATRTLKYAPDQARIPAGHGLQSGQFTFGREPAAAPAARIVLASDEDSATENKETITDQSNSFPHPHKPGPPHHSPILTPLSLPPPPPMRAPAGGVGGESEPKPKKQPPHDQPPLLQPGPPPPNSQPLPSGIGPGRYANGWVPAVPGQRPDVPRQRALNVAGKRYGCHICGTKDPGTKSGNFVGDHQDPEALNPPGRRQYFLPMCKRCSCSQGGKITQFKCSLDKGEKQWTGYGLQADLSFAWKRG